MILMAAELYAGRAVAYRDLLAAEALAFMGGC